MSDGSDPSRGAEISQQEASLVPSQPDNGSALTHQHWPGSKPLKITWMIITAFLITSLAGAAIAVGSLVVAIIVPIALVTLAVIGCALLWRTGVQLTGGGDGILVIRNLLRTYRVPVPQIFRMRTSEYGLRITMIDGRIITADALRSSSQRRKRPDQADEAMSAITRAVEAARSARPAETEAAIDAATPLRAKRLLRRMVVTIALGPATVIASFLVPDAGMNLEWRIRWLGVAYTPASLALAYSLLRARWPGDDKAKRALRH